jgi:hypothetical protein
MALRVASRTVAITALLGAGCLDLAAQTPHSVKLKWTWSQGNGPLASGFNVKRSTTRGGPYTTIATLPGTSIQSYTDPPTEKTTSRSGYDHGRRTGPDLVPGTVYYYVVTAFSGSVESAPSVEAKAAIPAASTVKRVVVSILNSSEPLVTELAPDRAGIFRSGAWMLNTKGDPALAFGDVPGDIPITGDWNGSGTTKMGVYRPSTHQFLLDYYGNREFTEVYDLGVGADPTDIPVAGDWNGDGKTKVGLFRNGNLWILDYNGDGIFDPDTDRTFDFGGVAGDVPVAGDWDGSGVSRIGIFRQGSWILDMKGTGEFDLAQAFTFGGVAGDVPVVGDWNGDGRTKVGVVRASFWVLDANGNRRFDGTGPEQDLVFPFGGVPGDKPVVGKWGSQ